MIAQMLRNEFNSRGLIKQVASLATKVLVDKDDPGLKNLFKGIGGFSNEVEACEFEKVDW